VVAERSHHRLPARCGLRLATPTGKDVTPAALARTCRTASPGYPAWSPDATKLAFAGRDGLYVVSARGTGLTRVTKARGRGVFGLVRPSWTPTPQVVHSHQYAPRQRCC
jgi:Tol biopolymer transport system component